MTDSPYIIEVDESNFMQVVVEGSMQQPVLVDFWADWCEPCKQLMPVLEKLAIEANGAFILAKCNADTNQNITGQIGIRSLPTVLLFGQGQPVDQFMGAIPEGEIRTLLEKHGISFEAPVEETGGLAAARELMAAGQNEQALVMLRQAQADDPENGDILIALGEACLATGDHATVDTVLGNLPESHANNSDANRLRGMYTFAKADDTSIDIDTLAAAVQSGEADSEQRYKYAVKLVASGQIQAAMDELLALMLRDREYGEDGARKGLIAIFDILGQDPLVTKYRRKMASYVL
ncbi:MAG: tetratricopeptide repeat protein [Granulosicoccaceae bacterium]